MKLTVRERLTVFYITTKSTVYLQLLATFVNYRMFYFDSF